MDFKVDKEVNKDQDVEVISPTATADPNKSGELIEEFPNNRIDSDDFHNQSDDPNSHSTPATGHAMPKSALAGAGADGLGWTVAIVVMVLILLTIFILIPIIYVRKYSLDH